MAAAFPTGLVISGDAGQTWTPVTVPVKVSHIHRVVYSADGTLWMGTREGVYFRRSGQHDMDVVAAAAAAGCERPYL